MNHKEGRGRKEGMGGREGGKKEGGEVGREDIEIDWSGKEFFHVVSLLNIIYSAIFDVLLLMLNQRFQMNVKPKCNHGFSVFQVEQNSP